MSLTRRLLAKTKEKQQRIGLFELDGGKVLFVPLPGMWEAHYTASRLRLGDKQDWSRKRLRRSIEQQGTKVPHGWITKQVKPFSQPWYCLWLLNGKNLPAHVIAVTPAQFRFARSAWNYSAHCRTAGLIWDTHRK